MKKLLLLLCSIGLHHWIYETRLNMYDEPAPEARRCKNCGKMQKKYRRTAKLFRVWFSEDEIKAQWQKEEKIDAFVKNQQK